MVATASHAQIALTLKSLAGKQVQRGTEAAKCWIIRLYNSKVIYLYRTREASTDIK